MRDIIVVGDPLISDDRSGSQRTNAVFEPVIKCIIGRTGATLWFHRDTRGSALLL